jgi:hypothetical protein
MPRRPTRFEILVPQIMKEAEARESAEPPSGYPVNGQFVPAWRVTVPFVLSCKVVPLAKVRISGPLRPYGR